MIAEGHLRKPGPQPVRVDELVEGEFVVEEVGFGLVDERLAGIPGVGEEQTAAIDEDFRPTAFRLQLPPHPD